MGQPSDQTGKWATGVRVRTLVATFLFWVAFFVVARLIFLAYHLPAGGEVPLAVRLASFRHGLRLDTAGAAYLTAIPGLLLILSAFRPLTAVCRATAAGYMALAVLLGSLGIAVDLEIYRHFDRRIDAGLLQYLSTPREAWISTGASPRALLLLIGVGMAVAFLLLFRRLLWPGYRRLAPTAPWRTAPTMLLIGALVVPARGGLQVVPVTASSAHFSRHDFANAAALNAWWVFFDSLYRGLDETGNPYQIFPADTARAIVAAALAPSGPRVTPLRLERPNVVVIIWEGASARAIRTLGGPLDGAPRFDRLAAEGILFRRFYAAGNRTDKGMASLLSGYPGLPRGSLLMVPGKSRSVPSIGRDLNQAGYHTAFVYGGELEFGSMQAYLRSHGYDVIVGNRQFDRELLSTKWGAPDSVAGARFVAEIRSAPEPFLGVWLTLSSHEPFDLPDGERTSEDSWQGRYLAALRYADRAIGRTIDALRQEPWWERTLVIVVADHGRRIIPLDAGAAPHDAEAAYRIPMLWLGGALARTGIVDDEIASQLDLAPTLRDLVGVNDGAPYQWGRSLLRSTAEPFAYYGFEGGYGLVTRRGATRYLHSDSGTVAPEDPDGRLGRALLQLTYQDYQHRR